MDIEFENLRYSIGEATILNNISGTFFRNNLIAILGSSGAGKTTLLDILSGHTRRNVSGDLFVNGQKVKCIKASYNSHEVLLQPLLTVKEAMMFPLKLTSSDSVSEQERRALMEKLLDSVDLNYECYQTRTDDLSGGERKRLTIAMELIKNPSVMIFDEPLSGLDNISAKHCLNVFKRLTQQGKTVILTLHQPSISTLKQFDKLYFLEKGECVYDGHPENLIHHLQNLNLPCPTTWSPAEYIIEIAQMHPEARDVLVGAVKQQKNINTSPHNAINFNNDEASSSRYRESFLKQFIVIFQRMMLQKSRNRISIFLQLFYYLCMGSGVAVMYYKTGNNATHAVASIKLHVGIMLSITFAQVMVPVLTYTQEFQLAQKEHFSKWYRASAYYLALSLHNLPVMMVSIVMYVGILFIFTDQPMQLYRFVGYYLACLLLCIGSEGIGITGCAIRNQKSAVVVVLIIVLSCFIICAYKLDYIWDNGPIMNFLLHINYQRCHVVLCYLIIYTNRPRLDCDEIYCYFSSTKNILSTVGSNEESFVLNLICLIGSIVVFRFTAYLALRYKLSHYT